MHTSVGVSTMKQAAKAVSHHTPRKREPWEAEKTEEDMEKYFWDISKSRKTVVALLQNIESAAPEEKKLQHLPEDTSEEKLIAHSEVVKYRDAVSDLRNGEESQEALERYGMVTAHSFSLK
nr:hypothetical protein BaRGS_004211 [Batillaria attramentaria]